MSYLYFYMKLKDILVYKVSFEQYFLGYKLRGNVFLKIINVFREGFFFVFNLGDFDLLLLVFMQDIYYSF